MLGFHELEKQFFILQNRESLRQSFEITSEGFLLGVGTKLSGLHPRLDHGIVLALLASAYGQRVSPPLLPPMEKAAQLWQRGEKCLAQMHLALMGLPPLTGRQAFALFAADALLKEGLAPRDLLKGLGLDPAPLDQLVKYTPHHHGPGEDGGRFTTADGAGANTFNLQNSRRQYAQASDPPPLKRLHPDLTYERDPKAKRSLEYWRKQPTEKIIPSLRRGLEESLRAKQDGTIMQGNTRIKVLQNEAWRQICCRAPLTMAAAEAQST